MGVLQQCDQLCPWSDRIVVMLNTVRCPNWQLVLGKVEDAAAVIFPFRLVSEKQLDFHYYLCTSMMLGLLTYFI
jgi:hypothetical protein